MIYHITYNVILKIKCYVVKIQKVKLESLFTFLKMQ